MKTRNIAQCLECGDVIESKDRHHFVKCSCGNLAVDGGSDYLKRCMGKGKWREMSTGLTQMKHAPETIAVDFDGTCVTHMYPRIGRSIGAEAVLKKLVARGDQLILWTMRHDTELKAAAKWFEDNGIPLYGINTNPTQSAWTDSPKAYAHKYIDDAAVGCPTKYDPESGRACVDWAKVEKILFPKVKKSKKGNKKNGT